MIDISPLMHTIIAIFPSLVAEGPWRGACVVCARKAFFLVVQEKKRKRKGERERKEIFSEGPWAKEGLYDGLRRVDSQRRRRDRRRFTFFLVVQEKKRSA